MKTSEIHVIHTKLMQIQFHASTTVSFLSKFMNAECQASIEIIENQFFRFRQFAFFYLKKKTNRIFVLQ